MVSDDDPCLLSSAPAMNERFLDQEWERERDPLWSSNQNWSLRCDQHIRNERHFGWSPNEANRSEFMTYTLIYSYFRCVHVCVYVYNVCICTHVYISRVYILSISMNVWFIICIIHIFTVHSFETITYWLLHESNVWMDSGTLFTHFELYACIVHYINSSRTLVSVNSWPDHCVQSNATSIKPVTMFDDWKRRRRRSRFLLRLVGERNKFCFVWSRRHRIFLSLSLSSIWSNIPICRTCHRDHWRLLPKVYLVLPTRFFPTNHLVCCFGIVFKRYNINKKRKENRFRCISIANQKNGIGFVW